MTYCSVGWFSLYMFRTKQAVPKLTRRTSRSWVFIVWDWKNLSALHSAFDCFVLLHDWKVRWLGEDVDDSSRNDCCESDQTNDGSGVISHVGMLLTLSKLSMFVKKREAPSSVLAISLKRIARSVIPVILREFQDWFPKHDSFVRGSFLHGVETRQHA